MRIGTEVKRILLSYFIPDPFLLERLYISFSIITKAGLFETSSYKELFQSSYSDKYRKFLSNNLSDALACLIDKYVRKPTLDTKGDWVPTFLILNMNEDTSFIINSVNRMRIILVSNHSLYIESKHETWFFKMKFSILLKRVGVGK